MRLLYLQESEYKAWKVLVAAKFCGIDLDAKVYDENADREAMDNNPWKRLPFLELEDGTIGNSNAIIRYIAKLRPDVNLMGANFHQSCVIDSWLEFSSKNVEVPACLHSWSTSNLMNAPDQQVLECALEDLGQAVKEIEKALIGREWLVGNELTIADIAIACSLVDPFTGAAGQRFRGQFPNVMRWFDQCLNLPQFKSVLRGRQSGNSSPSFQPAARGNSPQNKQQNNQQNKNQQNKKTPTAAPAAPAAPAAGGFIYTGDASPQNLAALQAAKDRVRDLKAQKADISDALAEMKRLKTLTGEAPAPKGAKGPSTNAKQASPQAAPKPAPQAAPAAAANAGGFTYTGDASPENLALLQAAKDKVREIKVAKGDVGEALAEMKRLKALVGEVDPPKKKKK